MAKRRMDAVDALKLAIERERGANRFYRQAADMTEDPNGKRTFRWLAKEESRHLAKLRQQLRSVLDNNKWLEWRRRTTPIERSEFPPISEVTGEVKVSAAELDALRQGIQSEKDAIAFYREAEDSTPDVHGRQCSRRWPGRRRDTWRYLKRRCIWSPRAANTSRSTGSPSALISRP